MEPAPRPRPRTRGTATQVAGSATLRRLAVLGGGIVAVLLAIQLAPALRTQAAPASAPVTGHPRLFVRAEDLPRLRSWAVPSNPIYQEGLAQAAALAREDMDQQRVPDLDSGGRGYEAYPTEAYAELFAFMSLISPNQATRDDYARRARTLLMYVMNLAALGPAKGLPFRDPCFASCDSNRSRYYGEGFALTVDWIYPYLSAADKATIRTVFLRWANEYYAKDAGLQSYPFAPTRGVYNDPSLVQSTERRWASNNYFAAHMRNLGLMALAFDAADDPGNQLRNFLRDATGSWLYMTDYLLRNDSRGGLLPEGFEYSPQTGGYIAQLLLALHTAGEDDPARWGPQVVFNASSYWDDALAGYLHSLSPRPVVQETYIGPVYIPAWYGDGQTYNVVDHIALFGPLGVYDDRTGNAARLSAQRWIQTHTAPGGASALTLRARDRNSYLAPIFYFMLFDPAAPPAPDPRAAYPTTFFAAGLNRLLARTDWGPDATWFSYILKWMTIDHQLADGNQFEFYRRGEWLTKERTGYGGANTPTFCDIDSSEYHNTLALQNDAPLHNEPGDFRRVCWLRGSQWLYVAAGDPTLVARSFDPSFVYVTGDATNLYNSTIEESTDILHASRSILWLKPDHVVVYDRAASKTANRFKRFWLNLPAAPTLAGNRFTMTMATGQQLFVTSLLPANAALSSDTGDKEATGNQAVYEPMTHRLRIEAPGGPASTRFLTVLQGADPGASADPVTLIQASSGTPYSGALVKNTAVLFPVDLGTPFASLTYAVPSTTTTHLITGLTPNASYAVATQTTGGTTQVIITPGAGTPADSGGVLRIGGAPPPTVGPTGSPTAVGATPTRTPTLPVSATATRTPTPGGPTATRTPSTVSGHSFTLQSTAGTSATGGAVADRLLSWVPGTTTNSLILRWSPENGFVFLPPSLIPLPPGAASYRDNQPLTDPTYCYILLAFTGELANLEVRALSDLLCISPGLVSGQPPGQFAVSLSETDTAHLSWIAPGGQQSYELTATRFDGSPPELIPLPGGATSFDHATSGQAVCYRLVASGGAGAVGGTDDLCAVPRIHSFGSPAANRAALDRLRIWLDAAAETTR